MLRHLVCRERLAAVIDDVSFGERRVLAHHEQRDDFARVLDRLGDR